MHQKVAALFMPGVNFCLAKELYWKLHLAVPANCHNYLDRLCEFIGLAAAIANEEANRSRLEKKWVHYNYNQSKKSLTWYE